MKASAVPLDDAQFEHAVAVLNNARPSPIERRWFLWLNLSVWGAILLTPVWFAVLLSGNHAYQFIPLAALIGSFFSTVPLLIANLPLIRKLARAAITEYRYGVSKDLKALSSRRFMTLLLILMPLGLMGIAVSVVAITEELKADSPQYDYVINSAALFFFASACVALYPMERGKRRLDAVARLRERVLKSKGEGTLPAADYDPLTILERVQIVADREETLAAMKAGDKRMLTLSRPFQEALARLTAQDLLHVGEALQALERSTTTNREGDAAADTPTLAVPGTFLVIDFVHKPGDEEIRVLSLRDAKDSAPATSSSSQNERPQ